MWKNPHVFKYAAQYGLRTHFASDVRMVRAMVTFLLLKYEHVYEETHQLKWCQRKGRISRPLLYIFAVI